MTELARRILNMATAVKGVPYGKWPGWSTGEMLMVALVLNRADVLDAMSFTIVEAFDRIDLDAATLRAIERKVQALRPEGTVDGAVIWR